MEIAILASYQLPTGEVKVNVDAVGLNDDAWYFTDGTGADGVDQIVFITAPDIGAEITADFEKGNFLWGDIGTHPAKWSTFDNISNLYSCYGAHFSSLFGKIRGCFASQCEYGDNHTGWSTEWHPGVCYVCQPEFLDSEGRCTDSGLITPPGYLLRSYGIDYEISRSDDGLLY